MYIPKKGGAPAIGSWLFIYGPKDVVAAAALVRTVVRCQATETDQCQILQNNAANQHIIRAQG